MLTVVWNARRCSPRVVRAPLNLAALIEIVSASVTILQHSQVLASPFFSSYADIMKAFFHRLHLGGSTKDKDRDSAVQTAAPKEKFPPLRSWPPQEESSQQRPSSTPASLASFKPLPDIVPSQIASQLSTRPLPSIDQPLPSEPITITPTPAYESPPPSRQPDLLPELTTFPYTELESNGTSRKHANGSATTTTTITTTTTDVQKKVAFISPPPTPIPTTLDRTLSDTPANGTPPAVLKTTVSRFQATYGKEPRGSISTAASSSKADVAATTKTSVKATSTRTASPYLQKGYEGTSVQSLRSSTPYSQNSQMSGSGSRILAAQSWSEVTEEDLVSNLGSRERTRQEVLFEIISSEER